MTTPHDPLRDPLRRALGELGGERDPAADWSVLPTGEPRSGGQSSRARLLAAAAALLLAVAAGVGLWARGTSTDELAAPPPSPSPVATDPGPSAPSASTTATDVSVPMTSERVVVASTIMVRPAGDLAPSIVISPGWRVANPTCNASACRYVHVTASGLDASMGYAVECLAADVGRFSTSELVVETDADGRVDVDLDCFYGHPGRTVYVTVGPQRSNDLVWPADFVDPVFTDESRPDQSVDERAAPDSSAPALVTTSTSTSTTTLAAQPAVVVRRGSSAADQPGCSVASCAYLGLDATGLEPGVEYAVDCYSVERGRFDTGDFTITADAGGEFHGDMSCFYGFPGDQVYLTVGPWQTETFTW